MTRAFLLDHDEGLRLGAWSGAAAIVVAAHAGLISAYVLLHAPSPQGAPMSPAVLVELAPIPVAPASAVDLAPGPEMVEAQLPPEPQRVELPPEPVLEKPVVATPEPPPPPKELKRVERKKPAPRSTAAPRSERRTAEVAAAPSLGSTGASALTSWRDRVAAHLQRQKRYPSGAEARREQGVVTLSFSVDRQGRVLSRSIARSSGYPELDHEVLALLARAEPLPPFPPDMAQARVNLVVPIRFSVR
jgi:protein TonB